MGIQEHQAQNFSSVENLTKESDQATNPGPDA